MDDGSLPLAEGTLPFFLLDAHEEPATPGTVYLFGKVCRGGCLEPFTPRLCIVMQWLKPVSDRHARHRAHGNVDNMTAVRRSSTFPSKRPGRACSIRSAQQQLSTLSEPWGRPDRRKRLLVDGVRRP